MRTQEAATSKTHTPTAAQRKDAASAKELVRFLTVREVCQLTRLSEASVRRRLGDGRLKKFKAGARTLVRIDDALALIREG